MTAHCVICGWKGEDFLTFHSPLYRRERARCPQCSSLERHRALAGYLLAKEKLEGAMVLEVAPLEIFSKVFRNAGARYFSTDLFAPSMVKSDLRKLPFRDDAFDIVICFHVLEHIKDDRSAIQEIIRVIKPAGVGYIQVPINENLTETREFDTPNPYDHNHVREPGPDYYARIDGDDVTKTFLDFASNWKGQERFDLGIEKATGLSVILRKIGRTPSRHE